MSLFAIHEDGSIFVTDKAAYILQTVIVAALENAEDGLSPDTRVVLEELRDAAHRYEQTLTRPEEWDIELHAAPGARFVTRQEYEDLIERYVRGSFVDSIITQAFIDAADDDGIILSMNHDKFYENNVRNVMADPDDEVNFQLIYDRFIFAVLAEHESRLIQSGLLAHRGNGNSIDYRLALPDEKDLVRE